MIYTKCEMLNREVYKVVKELIESNFTENPTEKEEILSSISQVDIRCFIVMNADYTSGSTFEKAMEYTQPLWENLSEDDWKLIKEKTTHKEIAESNLKKIKHKNK